ncbi:MAG: deoxyribodipyrimidine photolyase [Euryarchaeota archaeon]|nr:deoxyribodipyrimidine photolyase [Euryarchaeota archaeon]
MSALLKAEDSRLEPRIRVLKELPVDNSGEFVVYWMTATRRYRYNAALERAVELAISIKKPLLVVEGVSIRHRWTSERVVTFMVQGLVENIETFRGLQVSYLPWVENHKDSGDGLLKRISNRAAAMVIDDYPTYLPLWVMNRAKETTSVRLEAVDSTGVIPMKMSEKEFSTAHSFRRFVQKNLLEAFQSAPKENPLEGVETDLRVDADKLSEIQKNTSFDSTPLEWMWRVAQGGSIGRAALAPLNIDHEVRSIRTKIGGYSEARRRLDSFLRNKLGRYDVGRNDTDDGAASGLSPWIHFGHISSYEILYSILEKESWTPGDLDEASTGRGSRAGWWGLSAGAEAFVDQLITWRELGYNFAFHRDDHHSIESIPEWATVTLSDHSDDRGGIYTFEQIEAAETEDEVWNAAQRQLKEEGLIHNYLRMLWGKRILEWAPSPADAADWMIKLNDRWALDGRDPNSYTGIFWVMGRHDRPWGPKRPVFGSVRYMSSANTKRKLKLDGYLEQWSAGTSSWSGNK